MRSQPKPPKWINDLLEACCRTELLEEIEGDLQELYSVWLHDYGRAKARRLYVFHGLKFLRPFALKRVKLFSDINPMIMWINHFKLALRHSRRNPGLSSLNVSGLSIGMMVSMLIGLWIWKEMTFDQQIPNYDRIALVMQNQTFANNEIQTWGSQAKELGPALREDYPDVFEHVVTSSFPNNYTVIHENKVLTKRGMFMEEGGPDLLSLQMLRGDHATLDQPNAVLISESTAKAFFTDQDPVGELISIQGFPVAQVAGVFVDLPENSSFAGTDLIGSWPMLKSTLPDYVGWGNSWFQVFVELAEGQSMKQVSELIRDEKKNNIDEDSGKRFNPVLFLHPMSDWHLHADFNQGVNTGGRIRYVRLFGIIGGFVLLLACINFMNLTTARAEKRAMEVGIRKAVGSGRVQLIAQFYTESIWISLLSMVLALIGVQLLLPFFNDITQTQISLPWTNPVFGLMVIGFSLFTGMLAGSYPALYLSSFRPVRVLKGLFRMGRSAVIPRQVLVVVQFTVSVTLIIGTVIVFQQIRFVKDRPLGYNENNVIMVPMKGEDIRKHYDTFRQELLQTGLIRQVGRSEAPITGTGVTNSGLDWPGKEPGMQDEFVTGRVDTEFGQVIGWEIVDGRDFSADIPSDSMSFIINEAAVSYMGLEHPVGEQVKWGMNGTYTIIGVVRDIITQSPYSPVRQMFFVMNNERTNLANIKLTPDASTSEALEKIEQLYTKYDPLDPFEYAFVDQEYAKKFENEERIGKLAGIFASLAILISCLGLFGMAAFVAQRRTKEIGIRKVLGASVTNLWRLLSRDFVMLVLISCVLAAALSYYFLSGWLDHYEYRVPVSSVVFIAASLAAVGIALATVSFHTIRVARSNPVNSLRTE